MGGHHWAVVIVAVLALMAGCIGGDGEQAPESSDEPIEEDAADERGPDDGDRGSTDETGDEGEAPGGNETAAPAPVEEQIDWEGQFNTGACVPSGPNGCVGWGTSDGSTNVLSLDGALLASSLELRWDAGSPLMEQLRFSLSEVSSCGENCRVFESIVAEEGSSPLAIDVDGLQLASNATVALDVDVPRQTPSPVYGYVQHDQGFHVTGNLTVQPDADAG